MEFTPIRTDLGSTETEIGGGITVRVADANLVVSDTEVAVSVTAGFAGTVGGAVYVVNTPLAVLVGETVPHPGEHATPDWVRLQATPALAAS